MARAMQAVGRGRAPASAWATAFLVLTIAVAGCAGQPKPLPTVASPEIASPTTGRYKVGTPYQIDGVWYHPKEQPDYSEVGVASWYGPGFHGRQTANGERFDQDALTAAHTTLPMPVMVRVTNLENGRSLVLRVNDRGPFKHNRVIDVSRQAAVELGFKEQGTAKVKVDFLGPADLTSFAEARSAPAPAASEVTSPANALPTPRTAPVPAPYAPTPGSPVFVQIGAFTSSENAVSIYNRVATLGPTEIAAATLEGRKVYRVRMGPLADLSEAERLLADLSGLGHTSAKIVVD